jgi:hypothetical protein
MLNLGEKPSRLEQRAICLYCHSLLKGFTARLYNRGEWLGGLI